MHPHLRRIDVDTPNGPVAYPAPAAIVIDRAAALWRRAGIGGRRDAVQTHPHRDQIAMTATALDLDHLRQWIGNTEEHPISSPRTSCGACARPCSWRSATRSRATPRLSPRIGAWRSRCIRCRSSARTAIPTRGGFLPPVPLPRRMWAGGELEFFDPLRVGDEMKRSSRISDVTMKTGSTGALCFVSVQHEIATPRGIAIRERQDIVYRDMSTARPAAPAKPPSPPPPQNIAKATWPIKCCCSAIRR